MPSAYHLAIFFLIGLAAAATAYKQEARIKLTPSRQNIINFVGGAYGTDGTPFYYAQESYFYAFNSLPEWLFVKGNSLGGIPPASGKGPWSISVTYRGVKNAKFSGSVKYTLIVDEDNTTASTEDTSGDMVTYTAGYPEGFLSLDVSASSYTVLLPILNITTRIVYQKQPDTIINPEPISCNFYEDAMNTAYAGFAAAQREVERINSPQPDYGYESTNNHGDLLFSQAKVESSRSSFLRASNELSECRDRQAAATAPIVIPGKSYPRAETIKYVTSFAGGYDANSCSSIPTGVRGQGTISGISSKQVSITGVGKVHFGDCTEKTYKKDRTSFQPLENVSYEVYSWGGKKWARRISSQP